MVESDHKPLETIVKKPLANAPPRLQRMLLRLQKYDFVIQYTMFLKKVIFWKQIMHQRSENKV